MKTFRGVLYSILSLALSGFFFYNIYRVRDVAPRLKIRITDNEAINAVIDTMIKFANLRDGIMMIILGICLLAASSTEGYGNPVLVFGLPGLLGLISGILSLFSKKNYNLILDL